MAERLCRRNMAPPPPKPRGGHAPLAAAMVLLDWPPDHLGIGRKSRQFPSILPRS